jgi:hypothetical protein
MRPFALKVGTGDFAPAPGHRRIAICLLTGTLNSTAPFLIAAALSGASISPGETALLAIL